MGTLPSSSVQISVHFPDGLRTLEQLEIEQNSQIYKLELVPNTLTAMSHFALFLQLSHD